MSKTLSATTRRRLNVQGFCNVDDETLTNVAPWLRMAFGMCALMAGAVWLVAKAWAFQSGALTVGYILGGVLTGIGVLVSTTDICIPSMIHNILFPRSRTG